MEQTLVLIKPDGVARGLIGEVIRRFEQKGLGIEQLDVLCPSETQVKIHYAHHAGKPYFDALVKSTCAGPVVAICVSGFNVVKVVRAMVGSTAGFDSAPGTIRGDFSNSQRLNIVHASDSIESAKEELCHWFGVSWINNCVTRPWIYTNEEKP